MVCMYLYKRDMLPAILGFSDPKMTPNRALARAKAATHSENARFALGESAMFGDCVLAPKVVQYKCRWATW